MGRSAVFVAPDLSGILDTAKAEYGWTDADAQLARTWYDHFLELNWATPGGHIYMINASADKLWHTHITFTARYRNYCDSVLGFYLEHTPIYPRPKASAREQAAARAQYAKWGAVPDLIVRCSS